MTFVTSSVVERDARHGPHLEPAAMLQDRRLLDASPLTGADHPIDRLAEELRASGLTGGALATAANESVHNALTYEHGATSVHTTAAEALARGAGVCQDYAHVLLALTRRLGIASRYISGQLLGFGGSHAWVEVLVPDGTGHARVLSLDPTHGRATGYRVRHRRRRSRLRRRGAALGDVSRSVRGLTHRDQAGLHDRSRPRRLRRRGRCAPSPEPWGPRRPGSWSAWSPTSS